MRTTVKAWIGRSAAHASEDPDRHAVHHYRQPIEPQRSVAAVVVRALGWLCFTLLAIAAGTVGGVGLYLHGSLSAIRAHSPALKLAQRHLDAVAPGKPAIALLLGDNQRMGLERSAGGRSDTIMLIRADPATNSISLLSLPRDLRAPVWCPGRDQSLGITRIDYAFAYCGPAGSLETVHKLTGLRVNYLITVNFHGFKEIVNDIGGIWLDVDRRYYNKNVGTAATDYSNIDLEPGYQMLSGGAALQFVRFRHTDSDFYRQARQQEFLRALKDQLAQRLDPFKLPKLVSAITQNVEVGACGSCLSDATALGYALFALGLPHGHLLQDFVGDTSNVVVGGADELQPSPTSIPAAVYRFTHPPFRSSRSTQPVAAPPASRTSVTVLNGNGIPGAAASTSAQLADRNYLVELPPGGREANAPSMDYTKSRIYYDPVIHGAWPAAGALAKLIGGALLYPLQPESPLRSLAPSSMLVLVVGRNFAGQVRPPPSNTVAATAQPQLTTMLTNVRHDTVTGRDLLMPFVRSVGFPLEGPTVLESGSSPDALPGDIPARLYTIAPGHKAIRLVFLTAGNTHWGIEETDWANPPILAHPSLTRRIGGRTFELYTDNRHIQMAVLRRGAASYWVINSLLNALSNRTMLAIAAGLRPVD
jgi:LCP family protein required for cell wall assembly